MAFYFPLMPRLFMALHTEDRFPIVDILAQTPPIPATPLSMAGTTPPMPTVTASGPWETVLEGQAATGVEEALRGYLQRCRWFGGRGERILSMKLVEAVAVTEKTTSAYLTLLPSRICRARFGDLCAPTRLCGRRACGGAVASLPAGRHRPSVPARSGRQSQVGALRCDVGAPLRSHPSGGYRPPPSAARVGGDAAEHPHGDGGPGPWCGRLEEDANQPAARRKQYDGGLWRVGGPEAVPPY
jgi:hypothetical protein